MLYQPIGAKNENNGQKEVVEFQAIIYLQHIHDFVGIQMRFTDHQCRIILLADIWSHDTILSESEQKGWENES